MRRVLPAEPAELAHLETFGRLLPILRCGVVAAFTFAARHRDDVSHRVTQNLIIGSFAHWLNGMEFHIECTNERMNQ